MKISMPAGHRPRIEMVPLIDTFFLLLAFFISSVLTLEVVQGLPVELPRDIGAAHPLDPRRLLVTLTEEGLIQLEGETLTPEALRARLAGHPDRQALRVGLRGHRGARYERVVEVLEVVQQAGVSRVSLLTRPEGKQRSGAP